LAPEQVRVLPISDDVGPTAREAAAAMRNAGIRAHCDDRNDTLNYRIRDGEIMKVPYMAVVGKREAEAGTVAVRVRGAGKKQEVLSVEAFIARVQGEIRTRALAPESSNSENP
jgi:threonyl-tRNA synthetase